MLKEVVDQQDDYGAAFEALAKLLFKKAKRDPEYVSECKNTITRWSELCNIDSLPEINYMLGALAYISGNAEVALREFELFMSKTDADSKKKKLNLNLKYQL